MARRPIDFAHLRGHLCPRSVLTLRGWRPVWSRGQLARGPCPIHGSHSPNSRSLSVTDRVYYCHVCHATGDAVALHALLSGLPTYEAALDLAERCGVEIRYIDGRR